MREELEGLLELRDHALGHRLAEAGIDPQAYFEDALQKVSTTPATQIASLTPWAWAKAATAAAEV